MPDLNAFLRNQLANVRTMQGTNGSLAHGTFNANGTQVWDETTGTWIDRANANDPNQALRWKQEGGDTLSDRYFNSNSEYNTKNRSFYRDLASRSAASEDTFMSMGASSGLGLGGGLYAKQAEILRRRATEDAMSSWYKQSLSNEQLGLQANAQYEQSLGNLRGQYIQNEQFNAQRKDSWLSSTLGAVADIGLTAATGGFSSMFDSVFSGGGGGQYGDTFSYNKGGMGSNSGNSWDTGYSDPSKSFFSYDKSRLGG